MCVCACVGVGVKPTERGPVSVCLHVHVCLHLCEVGGGGEGRSEEDCLPPTPSFPFSKASHSLPYLSFCSPPFL